MACPHGDDCELPHCSKCGGHYDPYVAGPSGICDECQILDAAERWDRRAQGHFHGNYEAMSNLIGD